MNRRHYLPCFGWLWAVDIATMAEGVGPVTSSALLELSAGGAGPALESSADCFGGGASRMSAGEHAPTPSNVAGGWLARVRASSRAIAKHTVSGWCTARIWAARVPDVPRPPTMPRQPGRGRHRHREEMRHHRIQQALASSRHSCSDMAPRSLPRSLQRVGPMLPIGIARLALISAYEGAGSAKSITIS